MGQMYLKWWFYYLYISSVSRTSVLPTVGQFWGYSSVFSHFIVFLSVLAFCEFLNFKNPSIQSKVMLIFVKMTIFIQNNYFCFKNDYFCLKNGYLCQKWEIAFFSDETGNPAYRYFWSILIFFNPFSIFFNYFWP